MIKKEIFLSEIVLLKKKNEKITCLILIKKIKKQY